VLSLLVFVGVQGGSFERHADQQREFSSGTVGGKMTNTQGNRGWAAVMFAATLMMLAAAITAPAQTYSVLYAFKGGTDGSFPQGGVVADSAVNLYGTTASGGTYDQGTVFKLDASGNETILYSFTGGDDGGFPAAGVILDSAGNLYGTATESGFGFGHGVLFRLDPAGNETVLHTFSGGTDGAFPAAVLLRDRAGSLYGTTVAGGSFGFGVVFKLDPSENLTTLHSFAGYPTDGESPFDAVIRDATGNLYGTTEIGGSGSFGTVFEIDSAGNETVLHSFTGSDGMSPAGPLVRSVDGLIFGTTAAGGAREGTVFELDPQGNETVLRNFLGKSDGGAPNAGLIRNASGTLYGTTLEGGNQADCGGRTGCGVIFKLTPAGNDTLLYTFTGGSDGGAPDSNLLAYEGALYGTTSLGGNIGASCTDGSFGCGVVFKLSLR
jgi:uncharacterized repeat protein (TIGR03803 family)